MLSKSKKNDDQKLASTRPEESKQVTSEETATDALLKKSIRTGNS